MLTNVKFIDTHKADFAHKVQLKLADVPVRKRALQLNPSGTLLHWAKYEWKSLIPVEDRYDYLYDFHPEYGLYSTYVFTNPLIILSPEVYK